MKIGDKMRDALNEHMTWELQSAYEYMAMSAWLRSENLHGLASWMGGHAKEEVGHAMKIYEYLYGRLSIAEFGPLAKPKGMYKSVMEAAKRAFDHEIGVTKRVHKLVDLAHEENDKATENFLQWFVNEQVEEEAVTDDLVQRLNLIGDFKPGLMFLDREYSAKSGS